MPLARRLIAVSPLWRRRYPIRCYSYVAASENEDYDIDHPKNEGPTIKSENEGIVSPLIRFESAVICYPPSAINIAGSVYDYGLNEDCNMVVLIWKTSYICGWERGIS